MFDYPWYQYTMGSNSNRGMLEICIPAELYYSIYNCVKLIGSLPDEALWNASKLQDWRPGPSISAAFRIKSILGLFIGKCKIQRDV